MNKSRNPMAATFDPDEAADHSQGETAHSERHGADAQSLQLTIRIPRPRLPGRKRRGGKNWTEMYAPNRRWLIRLLALAVLAAVVADVFVTLKAREGAESAASRIQASAEVAGRVEAMFTYSSKTLNDDLTKASAQTTGSFRQDYLSVLDTVVRPAATKRSISTKAVATAQGVVEATTERVVILVFLTQTTTDGQDSPIVTGSRIKVSLRKTSNGWLVSDLKTV